MLIERTRGNIVSSLEEQDGWARGTVARDARDPLLVLVVLLEAVAQRAPLPLSFLFSVRVLTRSRLEARVFLFLLPLLLLLVLLPHNVQHSAAA